jgi:tetratricopeptide (TPR) repeat protein
MRPLCVILVVTVVGCASELQTTKPRPPSAMAATPPVTRGPSQSSPLDDARCAAHFSYSAATHAQNAGTDAGLAQAEEWLGQALQRQPDHAWALFRRGTIHLQRRRLDRARTDLDAAVALEPNLVFAHYNLACTHSLSGDTATAQESLMRALDAGYRNFPNVHRDTDLENLRAKVELGTLLAPYDEKVVPNDAGFQTMGSQGRLEYLMSDPALSTEQMERLADLASVDADHQVRVLGFVLRAKLASGNYDGVALGLCDSNGYVGKASAEALIAVGPLAEATAARALAFSVSDAPLYAIQVLGVIGSDAAPPLIAPFLVDGRPLIRIAAAQALAKLGAAQYAEAIHAALVNAPADETERQLYEAELPRAIDELLPTQ